MCDYEAKKLSKIMKEISLPAWEGSATPDSIASIDLDNRGVHIPDFNTPKPRKNPVLHLIEFSLNPLDSIAKLTSVSREQVYKQSKSIYGREVDPRYFGTICPLETPESEKIGISLHLAHDTMLYSGRLKNSQIPELDKYLSGVKPLSSPLPNGKWLFAKLKINEPKSQDRKTDENDKNLADWKRYQVKWLLEVLDNKPDNAIEIHEDYSGFLGYSALLVPFIQHNDGARAMMGAKNAKQAIPPIQAEPPLVKTGYEKEIARLYLETLKPLSRKWFNEIADNYSRVFDRDKGATIYYEAQYWDDEEISYPNLNPDYCNLLHEVVPYAPRPVRLSGFPAFFIVPREKVGFDEPFFDLPGIRDGELALGVNALVGYLPFFGYNFEDAIVISESLANRLTTRHIYILEVPPGWKVGKLHLDLKKGEITGFSRTTREGKEEAVTLPLAPEVRSGKNHRILGVFRRKGSVTTPWEVWILVEKPVQVGDKLTGRHGNKGVVSLILPDEKMPYFELDRKRYYLEAILNPHGVISRMNLGQILETHVGFVAKRLREMNKEENARKWELAGQPFHRVNLGELAQALQEVGLDSYGRIGVHVTDPDNPEIQGTIRAVVGYQYLLRLAHLADEKVTARGVSSRRTFATNQPTKGRKRQGGQRLGEMETWALLAHNAVQTLRELLFEASDARSENFLQQRTLKDHYTPEAFHALQKLLLGAFIDLEITEKEIRVRHLSDEEFLKETAPVKMDTIGNLLATNREDDIVDRFGYIQLKEDLRYVHPWFLNKLLKGKNYEDLQKLLRGEAYLIRENGEWVVRDWMGLVRKLVPEEERKELEPKEVKDRVQEELKKLDEQKRVLIGWKAAERWLKDRKDLQTLEKLQKFTHRIVPVVPNRYRLYCSSLAALLREAASKHPPSSINVLYARLLIDLSKVGQGKPPEDDKTPAPERKRRILHHLNQTLNYLSDHLIFSKEGVIRGYILGKRLDRSGRAVIIPDPKVPPDTILIPQKIWETIFQNLGRRRDLKVLLNRQPTLHKYSIFAFNHQESPDHTLHISPLICAPYNADFDGDTMAVYLPISNEAPKELERMTFLKHWKSAVTGKSNLHIAQDIKLGLWLLKETLNSAPAENPDLWNHTHQELLHITCTQDIGEMRELLSNPHRLIEHLQLHVLPEAMRSKIPGETLVAQRLRDLAQLAFRAATFSGVTFSIFELLDLQKAFDGYLENSRQQQAGFEYLKKALEEWLEKWTHGRFNSPALLVRTGARGKPEQLLQMIWGRKFPEYKASHLQVRSPEEAYATSLLTGHNPLEYFVLAFTTRLTMADKKLIVAHAGYLTRKLVHAAFELRITEKDCGSQEKERSPLTCNAEDGVCLACLGEAKDGLRVGDFIGILAATSVGERGTQLSMQTFHTAEAGQINAHELDQILTRELSSIEEAQTCVRVLKGEEELEGPKGQKRKKMDLYKNIRKPILATIFRARRQNGKILSHQEAVNRGDLFARMAFEKGRSHIVKALLESREYTEPVKSTLTRLFALGMDVSLKTTKEENHA